ncbi:MAG TPA: CopD family protein [Candidatus Binatia bacterium]|jgi:putative copper export protein
MPGALALVAAALIRWANLLALAGVMGGLVTELIVLPHRGAELDVARRRVGRMTIAALLLLAAASLADLVARAQTMTGGGIAATLTALPSVLGRTHYGLIWRLRAVALGLLGILCSTRWRVARMAALGTMLGVVFTFALSGHAADWGDSTPAALVDWGHAVAASAWAGSLLCSWWCVFRERQASLPRADLVAITRRFSRLAGWCVCVIVLSGLANGYVELATIPALWTSAYGRVLIAKLLLVLGALALGGANRYRVLPSLAGTDSSDHDSARALLARYVACEVMLVIAVFGCTALLGQLPPPRHGGSHGDMAHVTASAAL